MSKLILVPTPIGNLGDITYRAVEVLKGVDLILAEDTRQTRKLLQHYDIDTKLTAHHQHNEHQSTPRFVEQIQSGMSVALVSDAGSPGISDPGFYLVRACLEAGVEVESLPGATAFVPALTASGLPSDRFIFEGFLPHKKGRQTRIKALAEEDHTIILYESPHRLIKTLEQLAEVLGKDRKAAVARELTKIHEEYVRGSLEEIVQYFGDRKIKGEIVIIVAGCG